MNIKAKRAFITGVYGQDGSYLTEFLLSLGYEVMGLVRNEDSKHQNSFLFKEDENFSLCIGDISLPISYESKLRGFSPDELYNIAAISDLKTAKENPELTMKTNYWAFEQIAKILLDIRPNARVFQALSSRLLTPDSKGIIDENSQLAEPLNSYDEAKLASYEKVVLPLRKKDFFVSSGFLCNHESPRRGGRFVTGKIAKTVAKIANGKEKKLKVGNVGAKRDWSFAGDVVKAMHATLQIETPADYVIGSGTLHSVKDFINVAFLSIDMSLSWDGKGIDTKAYDEDGTLRVEVFPDFYQKDDNPVVGNIQKIKKATGWEPLVSFEELVKMMVVFEKKGVSFRGEFKKNI